MRDLWLVALVAGCSAPRTVAPQVTDLGVPLTAASGATKNAAIERGELAPWSLTASDGSGLTLARATVAGVVDGPLAYTEIELYFHNDEARVREGTFQITLPAGATVSRFAMQSEAGWMEAEVVPKLVARRAYDDFLHRRQDPALLEKAAGNQFTAKVFPILARADKHLVIGYFQELPATPYVVPLRGLPAIGDLAIEVTVRGAGAPVTHRLAKQAWQPDADFVVAPAGTDLAIAAGDLVAAIIPLGQLQDAAASESPAGITMLVDTSASRAGFERQVRLIQGLVRELPDVPLDVVLFDQETVPLFSGRVHEFGEAQVARIIGRGAAGASDLGQALDWVASHRTQPRVVVVTDGVITAGVEGGELDAKVRRLANVERLDVVLVGGLRDRRTAERLARALPRAGAVLELDGSTARALGQAVATDVPVEITGATWSYPHTLPTARAGTSAIVFAKLPPGQPLGISIAGKRRTLRPRQASAALIERAFAAAEIAKLEGELAGAPAKDKQSLREAIARASVQHRVLSGETSMLVLESDADYARYGIDRRALPDVLVVRDGELRRIHRTAPGPIPVHASADRASEPLTTEPGHLEPRPAMPAPAVAAARPRGPDGDRDGDGIADDADGCPDEPEVHNGFDDDDGCPDRGRVITTDSMIVILEPVYFTDRRALVEQRSYPILDAVAATMNGNPDIEKLEVQGHTDERGDDLANLQLSEARAQAVMRYLMAKGVDPKRLTAQGYGETQPVDARHTPDAWARNRRVDFLILERAGSTGSASSRPTQPAASPPPRREPPPPPPPKPAALTGDLAAIDLAVARGDLDAALARARDWHAREPGNVLALIGLGDVLEARHADVTAARVYGSIIDLFPGRADLRRFAGERLLRLSRGRPLAVDTFRRAVADRPDHLTGHRLLAYALVRTDRHAEAFAAILAGYDQPLRDDSYAGGHRVLADDAGIIAAVYAARVPAKRAAILTELGKRKLALATQPSTRFIVYWETDANDVDVHVTDGHGNHAFYRQPKLPTGGELYADITTGYGPECFAIPGKPSAGPYAIGINYYARGPMGYGMGLLEIQTFDPARGLSFDDRPYVVMNDGADVDLGLYP